MSTTGFSEMVLRDPDKLYGKLLVLAHRNDIPPHANHQASYYEHNPHTTLFIISQNFSFSENSIGKRLKVST